MIKTKITRKLLLLIACMLFGGMAMAQTVAIQGVVRDRNERAVDDGMYDLTFKIYEQKENGTAIWEEIHSSVRVLNAVFNVEIGSITPLNLAFDTTYYVGVTVGTLEELKPRILMSNYPYAMAVNGAKNKFPSAGNVIIGEGGTIIFPDNSVLSSANSGSANLVSSDLDAKIIADSDANGTGEIQFNIGTTTKMALANDGTLKIGKMADMIQDTFYINLADTSKMNIVTANAFYSTNDTSYYVQPQAGSVMKKVIIGADANSVLGDAPLTVYGSSSEGFGGSSFRYFSYGTAFYTGGVTAGINTPTSIFASGSIFTQDIIASLNNVTFSDKRIKDIIGVSDSENDLNLLNKIKITEYQLIDKKDGDKVIKKVIAQEVKEVFPNAVSLTRNVLPSVYEKATSFSYDEVSKTLKVTTSKKHDFALGNLVDLYSPKSILPKLKVTKIINENTFEVALNEKPEDIFVYGKWVDDFHTVDYDAISMLNVSATQALAKKVAALEAENKKLKQQVAKVDALASTVAKLEAMLLKNSDNNKEQNTQNSDKK